MPEPTVNPAEPLAAPPVESADGAPIIRARGIEKFYTQPDGSRSEIIAPSDLEIFPGKIVALLGPSGCGKSTLLRILAGLAPPSAGEVLWHGHPLDGQVPNVGIVFQSFALFPWLTVLDNVEAPLEARGVAAAERRERAVKILDAVGLDGFESAYPKELSGGMKQRVGFARALVIQPEVLFMDEPFSALDVLTAETLRGELLELWLEHKIPTRSIFLVTHNIEEAVVLADRIIVLGTHPAHIRADFPVTLPHPRKRKDVAFLDLVDRIYQVLTQPTTDFALPASAVAGAVRAPASYPVLSYTRPGRLAALLEILADRGGSVDLHAVASALALDISEMLPIVETAELLGFITVDRGEASVTLAGERFAAAGILERKQLFRRAALDRVTLLRQIEEALRAKPDHTLPDDFFRDLLEEQFSPQVASQQFETAIQWGRYAEIFDYDADRGRLVLTEPQAPEQK
ncbi:MAG: nitrate/sulfonate/bicarbonate ABC transporter ATP-binding protein [Candidatus Acidiferrales bacterium]